jgi:hypothetical protein
VTTSPDIDAAKDRLTDSLSNAREVTIAAVTEDIAPAVSAAVDAAREMSGPAYAEVASLASDVADAMLHSGPVEALRSRPKPRRRRWPFIAGGLAIGATVATVVRRRAHRGAPTTSYSAPAAADSTFTGTTPSAPDPTPAPD